MFSLTRTDMLLDLWKDRESKWEGVRDRYLKKLLKYTNKVFVLCCSPPMATDAVVPPVSAPPRDAGCRAEATQPALHPPGVLTAAGSPPDAALSSSTSSSPTALPSLSRSDPGPTVGAAAAAAAAGGGGAGGGGGLQSRSNSSERLLEAASGASEDYHDPDGTRRARAVENQYSFY